MADKIRLGNHWRHIQVPFFYVGKKHALRSILAHEMAHASLASKGVSLPDTDENEMLTDLVAIFLGLGKLFMNGFSVTTNQDLNEGHILGLLVA